MWAPSLSFFLCLVSLAPAFSSPIDQDSIDPVSQLEARNIDPGNTTVLTAPTPVSHRPHAPYAWPVPGVPGSYVRFTRYGAEILAEDGYLFMLRLEGIILHIIQSEGKESRLPPHHSWAWDRCKFEVTMADNVKAVDLLKWIVGSWRFMKKNGYVEADMTFQTSYPFRDVGTATFRSVSVDQE